MGLGLFLAGLCGLHLKFVLRSPTPLLKTILTAAISSVLIATVEELLFRGLLLKALMNVWNTSISVVTGSLLFALLHFTSPINFPPSASVAWYDGWRLALHSFTSIVPNLQWPYFLNLVMLGSWLGLKTLREGHLGGCIGLHGGLVFILLVLRRTVEVTASDPSGWFGKGRLTDSFLSCIVLGIVTVFTWARSPVSRGKQPSLSEIH
jgi:membrane protease YdiL (CAAX protease family)